MQKRNESSLSCEITNKTKGKLPRLPFVEIKESLLGKKYSVSLVFIGDNLSQKLNRAYRNKNKPTNVLSFSLSKKEGEIFINVSKSRSEAKKSGEKISSYIAFLFIHGLLHLKGMEHGSRMEAEELRTLKKFNIRRI